MKKQNVKRSSLFACGISLVLCMAMLIGTTFAWFSDTVSNKGNRIQAGTLDVEMYKNSVKDTAPTGIAGADGWENITNLDTDVESPIFKLENAQPGDTQTAYVAVKNAGSLALKYNLDVIVSDASLADALTIETANVTSDILDFGTLSAPEAVSSKITDDIIALAKDSALDANKVTYFQIKFTFMESAGNTYQDKSFAADIVLSATQTNANATIVKARTVADINSAKANETIVLMNNITSDEAIDIKNAVNIDLNKYTLSVPSFKIATAEIATIDIANGNINCTGDFEIDAAKATINQSATITANGASIDVSSHTYNLTGQLIVAETLEIKGETTFVKANEAVVTAKTFSSTDNAVIKDENNAPIKTEEIPASVYNIGKEETITQAISNAPKDAVILLEGKTYNESVVIKDVSFANGSSKIFLKGKGKDLTKIVYSGTTDKVSPIEITECNNKNISIDGCSLIADNNAISRGLIWTASNNTSLNVENCFVASTSNKSDIRGISVYQTEECKLSLKNTEVNAKYYALNFASENTQLAVTVDNSKITATWAAINSYASNSTFTFNNTLLEGQNNYSGQTNDFSTIVIDGALLNGNDNFSIGNDFTFNSCTINAYEATGNEQHILSTQYGAKNNNIKFNQCNFSRTDVNGNSNSSYFHCTPKHETTGNKISINGGEPVVMEMGNDYALNGNSIKPVK